MDDRRHTYPDDALTQDELRRRGERADADATTETTTETPTASNQADGHAKDEPEPPVATDDTPTSDK